MKIEYVAFDSFGIKSSCLKIKTEDCNVTIDPGIASETGSFPLTPEEKRYLRRKYETSIREACSSSEVIILTHYHYDHHIPDPELYEGKTLLIKDAKNNVNRSQKGRAERLLTDVKADVKVADGREFKFGSTGIFFSKPFWHGTEGTSLGYVLMVTVQEEDKRLLYTSDVDGPVLEDVTDAIVEVNPDVLVLDGPPTYLLGYIMAYYNLARSIINICRILRETDSHFYILDHHVVRDYRYPDLLYEVYREAKRSDKTVCTAAELLGRKPKVLEGFEKNGATRWRSWKRFKKEDMIEVLRNAVENDLIQKKWLERAENL